MNDFSYRSSHFPSNKMYKSDDDGDDNVDDNDGFYYKVCFNLKLNASKIRIQFINSQRNNVSALLLIDTSFLLSEQHSW